VRRWGCKIHDALWPSDLIRRASIEKGTLNSIIDEVITFW